MKKKSYIHITIIASVLLGIIILDTKTAILGAQNGIELCIRSIIPSLLPFCILSKIINSTLIGYNTPILKPIGRLTGMPVGTEPILLLSFISGYPLGAQSVNDAFKNGSISHSDAIRILAFCNNAGPAFIFGILSCLFPNTIPLWCLYSIHILSAIFVGVIIPGKSRASGSIKSPKSLTISQAVEGSIKTIGLVCTWIIIFKILLQFFIHWFSGLLEPIGMTLIAGTLELANGCIALQGIECLGLRYIFCAMFLAFGGCCISLQTAAVTKQISLKKYFPGKVLQTAISGLLAGFTQYFLFVEKDIFPAQKLLIICFAVGLFSTIILYRSKKVVAIV